MGGHGLRANRTKGMSIGCRGLMMPQQQMRQVLPSFIEKRALIGTFGLFGLLNFLLNGLGASGVPNLQQQFLGGFQFANTAF